MVKPSIVTWACIKCKMVARLLDAVAEALYVLKQVREGHSILRAHKLRLSQKFSYAIGFLELTNLGHFEEYREVLTTWRGRVSDFPEKAYAMIKLLRDVRDILRSIEEDLERAEGEIFKKYVEPYADRVLAEEL